jgi:hypothetical protein
VVSTGTGLLSLVASASCLTNTGAHPAPNSLAVFFAARCGAKFIQFHQASSTRTM